MEKYRPYKNISYDERESLKSDFQCPQKRKEAIDRLVLLNIQLPIYLTEKQIKKHQEIEWEALLSEANLKLFEAANTYNPNLETNFACYATNRIRLGFLNLYETYKKHIRIHTNLSPEEWEPVLEYIATEKEEQPDIAAEIKSEYENIANLVENLPEAERETIKELYGFYNKPQSLRAIGRKRKITSQRIGQIEFEALKTLRRNLRTQKETPQFANQIVKNNSVTPNNTPRYLFLHKLQTSKELKENPSLAKHFFQTTPSKRHSYMETEFKFKPINEKVYEITKESQLENFVKIHTGIINFKLKFYL
jgi:RNA polymerase sigma factor (sigma-70 family)